MFSNKKMLLVLTLKEALAYRNFVFLNRFEISPPKTIKILKNCDFIFETRCKSKIQLKNTVSVCRSNETLMYYLLWWCTRSSWQYNLSGTFSFVGALKKPLFSSPAKPCLVQNHIQNYDRRLFIGLTTSY